MNEKQEKAIDIIRTFRVGALITVDNAGTVTARPMLAAEHLNVPALWFASPLDTEKVQAVRENPNVGVYFSEDAGRRYISLSGTAELVDDQKTIESKWIEPWREWFIDGPESDNIILIKFTPERAEWWDSADSTEKEVTF